MRVNLSFPDLSCEHCRRAVQGALGDLGFKEVEVDLVAKRVAFEAEEDLVPAALKALAEEGYPATWM